MTNKEFSTLREGAIVRNNETGTDWIVTHLPESNVATIVLTDTLSERDCADFSLEANGSGPGFRGQAAAKAV